jgi:quercetin dioxygenase-like cupin family protein
MPPDRSTDTSGTEHAGRPPRTLRPALDVLDLGAEGVAVLTEPQWSGGDRNSKTLLKTESLRVVLSALRAGAVIENDDPDEAAAIHALQGTITLRVDAEEVPVQKGQLVVLAGGDPWRLSAASDSLFLLVFGRARTISGSPPY